MTAAADAGLPFCADRTIADFSSPAREVPRQPKPGPHITAFGHAGEPSGTTLGPVLRGVGPAFGGTR